MVRRRRLRLEDLYLTDGAYLPGRLEPGRGRGHPRRLRLAWGGLVIPALKPLYDYAWFVGFAAAFGVYALLMRGAVSRIVTAEAP